MISNQMKNLPIQQLQDLATDAEYRIGSHVSGGNPVSSYIKAQQKFISSIQKELLSRK